MMYSCSLLDCDCSIEFLESSQSIQKQLLSLKSEMDILKIEDKQTQLDRLHEESMQRGDTKYQTLQKVGLRSVSSQYYPHFPFLRH